MKKSKRNLERLIGDIQPLVDMHCESPVIGGRGVDLLQDYGVLQTEYEKRYGKLYLPEEKTKEDYNRRLTILHEHEVYSRVSKRLK